MSTEVKFIGGPYDGQRGDVSRTVPVVIVGRSEYLRIDDPETGDFLGGYAYLAERGTGAE